MTRSPAAQRSLLWVLLAPSQSMYRKYLPKAMSFPPSVNMTQIMKKENKESDERSGRKERKTFQMRATGFGAPEKLRAILKFN